MKRVLLFLIVQLAFRLASSAQPGNYFLSNYTPSDERIDYLTYGMAQDDRGVLYFASKSNVLQFDGRNWTPVPTPGPVYTVVAFGKDIFVGGLKGYGKLIWGPDNTQVYHPLSQDHPGLQIITSQVTKDKVWFLSQTALYGLNPATGVTDVTIKIEPRDAFSGLFAIAGTLYVESENHGLRRLDQGKLVKFSLGLPNDNSIIFCAPLPGASKVLIGDVNNKLYIYDPAAGLKTVSIKEETFLESNVMVGGVWINEKLLAIATLRGGVIFIDPSTGITEEIVNFQTGLPDNEVYSILSDKNQGIWVAHDYGFTRIAPYLPFRSYSHYPGLMGNLLCARNFNNQIYVGTTLGLYNLLRKEVYETETFEIRPKAKQKGIAKFFGGLFSSRAKQKAPPPAAKGTRLVLKSLQYEFKKVEGVNGKVSQLTEAHGKLLASGVTGVMEVDGLKSRTITNEPVRSVFLATSLNQLLVSTLDEEVKTYESSAKGWKETHLLDTLQEDINYIFEDKLQNIWLCGRSNVFKVETVDNAITDVTNIPFNNPSLDEPVGVAYGSEVYVAASGEINRFDFRKNAFVKYHSLSGSKKYFASAGYFWFYDGHYWLTVNKEMEKALKLEWLVLFQNIRFLAPVGHGEGLWVITANNQLYKFSPNKIVPETGKYPLFLREVRGHENKILPGAVVEVNQLESAVEFDFIQPNYFGMRAMQYHYRVNGLSKDWTEYSSSNNIVPISYLPTGSYKVEIQTRDLLGNESEIQQIKMEVIPPYWKKAWFYGAEMAFFGLLVFLSIKLSSANSKYRYISDLLSVLTVIMLIQFIQTVASSMISIKSTPVVDFFIQVIIALMVLPIESYLRKFMNRSPGTSLQERAG